MKVKVILFLLLTITLLGGGIYIFKPIIYQVKSGYGEALPKYTGNQKHKLDLQSFIEGNADRFDSLTINIGNKEYFRYGKIEKAMNLASIRKSILSLLIGIGGSKGMINLDKTIKELGINESKFPLTTTEKSATIRDLLMARSGVYISSGGESKGMKKNRPKRGKYKPGEFFYYNNWDFNVLGYIFKKETGLSIAEALLNWLAIPLEMQDFDPSHVVISSHDGDSKYPIWRIYMSARDLGKIGSLLINRGRWKGTTLVPAEWIQESIKPYSDSKYEFLGHFGYLWWIDRKYNVFGGLGSGGQFLLVDQKHNFCISLRKDLGTSIAGWQKYSLFEKAIPESILVDVYKIMLKL